jgi:plasmid stabilization system protein ParE
MGKRGIEWSSYAKGELFEILEFYNKRNGNRKYSNKIYQSIQSTIKQLQKFPRLGIKTSEDNIRVIFEGEFSVFYESTTNKIIIHLVWDNQRNPEQSKFSK